MTDPIKYINDMDWHRVRFRFSKKQGVVLSPPGLRYYCESRIRAADRDYIERRLKIETTGDYPGDCE